MRRLRPSATPSANSSANIRMHNSPQSEDLGDGYGSSSLVLHDPSNASKAVGCYSPCAKLTYSQWGQARIPCASYIIATPPSC